MAARSSLTVVSGGIATAAWANSIRDHLVPYTTLDDVSTEGMMGVNTATDRVVIHDGTASRRLTHYSAAGRTGLAAVSAAGLIGSGVTAQTPLTSIASDSDGFYTGWTGSVYGITIPATLGGLYSMTIHMFSSVVLSGGSILRYNTSTLEFQAPTPAGTNWGSFTTVVPLVGGQLTWVQLTNLHSAAASFDVRVWLYRIAL